MISLLIKIMAAYFLFIAVFGGKDTRYHAVIIFLASIVIVLFPLPPAVDVAHFIEKKETYIMLDGAVALIMTMFMRLDKAAWKQALLLSFATLCHIMLIFSIQTAQSGFFHSHYKELIIMVGLLQMMVSYDGFIHALSRVQELLLRTYHYFNRCYQGLFTHKDGGKRA